MSRMKNIIGIIVTFLVIGMMVTFVVQVNQFEKEQEAKKQQFLKEQEARKQYILNDYISEQLDAIITANDPQIHYLGGMISLTCVAAESNDNRTALKRAFKTFFEKDYTSALRHPFKTAKAYKKMKRIAKNAKAILWNMNPYDKNSREFLETANRLASKLTQSTWQDILNKGGNKRDFKQGREKLKELSRKIAIDIDKILQGVFENQSLTQAEKNILNENKVQLTQQYNSIISEKLDKAMRINKNFNFARTKGCLSQQDELETVFKELNLHN